MDAWIRGQAALEGGRPNVNVVAGGREGASHSARVVGHAAAGRSVLPRDEVPDQTLHPILQDAASQIDSISRAMSSQLHARSDGKLAHFLRQSGASVAIAAAPRPGRPRSPDRREAEAEAHRGSARQRRPSKSRAKAARSTAPRARRRHKPRTASAPRARRMRRGSAERRSGSRER